MLWWLCISALALVSGSSAVIAQEPPTRVFTETAVTIEGPFLKFFDGHGGLDILGAPISQESSEDGVRVQYFRNVRLELHPENPPPYLVQTGLLGDQVGQAQPPIHAAAIPFASDPTERYYPQTGHTVQQGFLTFFDRYGGLDLFGYPITELLVEPDGRVTQWFQKALLEWAPNGSEENIRLAPLGEIVYGQEYP